MLLEGEVNCDYWGLVTDRDGMDAGKSAISSSHARDGLQDDRASQVCQ